MLGKQAIQPCYCTKKRQEEALKIYAVVQTPSITSVLIIIHIRLVAKKALMVTLKNRMLQNYVAYPFF